MFQEFTFFKPTALKRGDFTDFRRSDTEVNVEKSSKAVKKYISEKYKYEAATYYDDDEAQQNKKSAGTRFVAFLTKKALKCNEHLPPVLPYYYYLVAMNTIQLSLMDMMNIMDLIVTYGAFFVVTTYFLVSALFGVPLYLVFFFLSNYSRQKYVKFWSSAPVLKGMILPVIVLNLAYAIMNISMAGTSALLFFTSIVKYSNLKCNFQSGTYANSCTVYSQDIKATGCTVFSFLAYFNHVFGAKNTEFHIKWNWLIPITIFYLWIIMLCLFSRVLLGCMVRFAIVFWSIFIIPCILTVLILGTNSFLHNKWAINFWVLFKMEFWLKILLLSLRRISTDDLLTYGAFTPERRLPTVEAYVAFFIRFICVTTILTMVIIALNIVIKDFGITDNCFDFNGLQLFLVVVPEALSNHFLGKFTVPLYYLLITCYGFMSAFFSINSLLEALYNGYTRAHHYRKLTIIVVVIGCVAVNTVILNNHFISIYNVISNLVLPPAVLLGGVALFILVYSPTKIMNDFQFNFGYRLPPSWQVSLKFFAVIALTSIFGFVAFDMWKILSRKDLLINGIVASIFIAPIAVQAVTEYINFRNGKIHRFMKPDMKWGPPSKEIRDARRKFNPKRECRYLSLSKCVHDCLLESEALKVEMERWSIRQEYFYKKYHVMRSDFEKIEDNIRNPR